MRARLVPLGEARQLEPAWRALAARAVEPNPFAESLMLGPAAQGLPNGADAQLLVVDGEHGELLFGLPMVRCRRFRRVPLEALATWRHPQLSLGLPLVCPEAVDDAWQAALSLVREDAPWVAFEHLPIDGLVGAALLRCLTRDGSAWSVFEPWERAILVRRPDNTYTDGRISSRRLKALRRHRRHLEAAFGKISIVDLAATNRWRQGIEAFLQLEAAGWKGRDGGAMACHPAQAAWFRESMRALQSEGRLQLWVMQAGTQPLAYQVNAVAGDTVFHLKVAYDERYAAASPGLQLELAMVDEFHHDERLRLVESCTERGTRVSEQLYPDRRAMGTILVAGSRRGAVAVRGFPHAARAYDLLRDCRSTEAPVR